MFCVWLYLTKVMFEVLFLVNKLWRMVNCAVLFFCVIILCYFVYFIDTNNNQFFTSFRRFPTIFRRFLEGCPKVIWTFLNIFKKLSKISEVWRRLPREIRRCFNYTNFDFQYQSINFDCYWLIFIIIDHRFYLLVIPGNCSEVSEKSG